jgi:secondary thiamine-phosphate synthase enzyme
VPEPEEHAVRVPTNGIFTHMEWIQKQFTLKARSRGFHLVTDEVVDHLPELRTLDVGILHLFIQHTSASLSINENASPDVRGDMERHFNTMVPENAPYYEHNDEGPDDMPAHIKASLLGSALSIPIGRGRLLLGRWQGIYLCEHRDQGGSRRVVATIMGSKDE